MTQATCGSCGAHFQVDFAPGTEFTCGGCGAVVVVPEPAQPKAAPAPRPVVAASPARPKAGGPPPPRPRAAPPPRPAREPKPPPPPRDPAEAKKQKTIILAAVGGTLLILGVLGALMMFKSSPEPTPRPAEPSPATKSDGTPSKETPAAETPAASRPAEPRPSLGVRPSDPVAAAKWDSLQDGAGVVEVLKFADLAYERADQLEAEGKKVDATAMRIDALLAYAEVNRREPNQERARDRRGFVKYDPAEAKRLAAIPNLPRKLKMSLDESIEQIQELSSKRKVAFPLWLSVEDDKESDLATEWRKALREARVYEAIENERVTDPFYKRADSLGAGIEGDVGPVLKKKHLVGGVFKPMDGPTFDIIARKPFVIAVQRDKDYDTREVGERWSDVLMQLRETFIARFRGMNLPPMDRPTPVLVLHYDSDYTKYLRRGDTEGSGPTPVSSLAHFEPFSKRLVTWNEVDQTDRNKPGSMSQDAVRTVIFHEGTHQLVDYYTKQRVTNLNESLWFSEGIADYFGGHGRAWDEKAGKWRYEPGLLNEERIQQVGGAKEGGFLFKLKDLLAYTRADYERDKNSSDGKTGTAYAQGWALVYLLSNWQDNKHRAKFDAYVKKEFNGESGVKAFEEVFGAGSIEAVEKELLEMIDVLYKASKERKIVNGKLLK
jgi:hypothetical protein